MRTNCAPLLADSFIHMKHTGVLHARDSHEKWNEASSVRSFHVPLCRWYHFTKQLLHTFTTKEMILIFEILYFPFICSNFPAAAVAHGVYIYLSWYDIPELMVSIMSSWWRVTAYKEATEPSALIGQDEVISMTFTIIAIVTLLTITKYLCHIWPLIFRYYICPSHNPFLVEQELLTFLEHLSSPPVFVGFVLPDL